MALFSLVAKSKIVHSVVEVLCSKEAFLFSPRGEESIGLFPCIEWFELERTSRFSSNAPYIGRDTSQ